MSPVFVGVDGGATRTRCVVVDGEGRELARTEGLAGAADPRFPERAAAAAAEVVTHAVAEAGLTLPVDALWVGLAGTGRETTRAGVEVELARRRLAGRLGVGTDVEAAFADAFDDGPGILVVSGTGSVAWGRGSDGTRGRVGGWGSVLGDEGSGYAVGLEALRRVVRVADGRGRGRGTALRDAVLEALAMDDAGELVPWASSARKSAVAALVPVVVQVARGGDPVAGEILVRAVEELDGHVATLLETLGPWPTPPTVALAGGLLDPAGPLRRGMEEALARHPVPVLERAVDPASGAVGLARSLWQSGPEEGGDVPGEAGPGA